MAATKTDFTTNIVESGATLASQWGPLVRAVQGLGAVWSAKTTTGSEPTDVLTGLVLGDSGGSTASDIRVQATDDDLVISENTGSDGSPTWVALASLGSPTGADSALTLHDSAGAEQWSLLSLTAGALGIRRDGTTTPVTLAADAPASAVAINLADVTFGQVLLGPSGAVGAPAFSFSSDPDSGMYREAANAIALGVNGVKRLGVTTSGVDVVGNATVSGTLAVTGATTLTGALTANGGITLNSGDVVLVDDGSVGAPGLAFTADTNTGLYRPSADTLGLVAGGTSRVNVDSSNLTSTVKIVHPAGTAAAPAIYPSGDSDTGIYAPSANNLGLAASGALVANVSSDGVQVTGRVTQSNPGYLYAYQASGQSIPNNSLTNVTWDSEFSDTRSWHSTVTNTDQILVDETGMYAVTIQIQFANGATGRREVHFRVGSNSLNRDVREARSAENTFGLTFIGALATGSIYRVAVFQNSGAAASLTAGIFNTYVVVVRLS